MQLKHIVISVWAVAGLSLAACSGAAQPAGTVLAAVQPEPSGLVAEGQVQPRAYVDLSFSAGGPVAEVLVAEGESVSAGQVLARLADSPAAAAEAARARQAVQEAQQALAELSRGASLALAQAQLAEASAAQQLEAAEQAVEDFRAAQVEAATEDDAPTALELATAEAQVTVAKAQLALAQAEAKELEAAGVDPAAQAAAEARLATNQAVLTSAEAALAALELTAPRAGTVVGLTLKVGQHIGPGQPALTLADFSSWVIRTADLTELEVVQVRAGQTVEVRLDARPGLELSGTLETLDPRYEDKRGDVTYTGTIGLSDVDPALRWGMTAALWFQP